METTPDKWVIVGITKDGEDYYKVFGTWAGGYLDGDAWKLNSGIESFTDDEDYYYFNGFSGSVYKCHKKQYGFATSYTQSVLEKLNRTASINNVGFIIFDEDNWKNHLN